MKLRWWGVAASLAVSATLAGCSSLPVWKVAARLPQLRVTVDAGCPGELSTYRDVSNDPSGLDAVLAPPGPDAGLVCRYTGLDSSQPAGPAGRLYRQARLTTAQAQSLAATIGRVWTTPPQGSVSCPRDFDSATVIAFAYPQRSDVDLWYHDTGCATLDNGAIAAWEIGNPPFYRGFIPALDALAPPCDRFCWTPPAVGGRGQPSWQGAGGHGQRHRGGPSRLADDWSCARRQPGGECAATTRQPRTRCEPCSASSAGRRTTSSTSAGSRRLGARSCTWRSGCAWCRWSATPR